MFGIVGGIIGSLLGIVNKSIPDETARLNAVQQILTLQSQIAQGQSQAVANDTSGTTLQRNWRPIIMLLFGTIIANNYLIAPLVHMFYTAYPVLPIPPDMWNLMSLGMGGYIVGRSAEKIAAVFKK